MTTNLLDFDLDGLAAFCEGLGEKRANDSELPLAKVGQRQTPHSNTPSGFPAGGVVV